MAKEAYKIRCEDCPNLVKQGGKWLCVECFNQKCADIDDCPEGVTAEQVTEIQDAAAKVKIDTGAAKGKPREKSDKPKKLNPQKVELIALLAELLTNKGFNATIVNPQKEITLLIDNNNYSVSLTLHKSKKT
jgi:hypothetical protein